MQLAHTFADAELNRTLELLVRTVADVLTEQLVSLVLYGSIVFDDLAPGCGDLDFLAVTAEQWIKEGKHAMKWTRLSCRLSKDNAVRLQLFVLAYNLANFLRRLTLPRSIRHWSLTTLREKLVKPPSPFEAGYGGPRSRDRREGGSTLPVCDLPAGRGCSTEAAFRGDSGEDSTTCASPHLTDHALCAHLCAQRQASTPRVRSNADKEAAKPPT